MRIEMHVCDWSSDVCSSDLKTSQPVELTLSETTAPYRLAVMIWDIGGTLKTAGPVLMLVKVVLANIPSYIAVISQF